MVSKSAPSPPQTKQHDCYSERDTRVEKIIFSCAMQKKMNAAK
jgi:hypothetical protein